MYKRQSVEVAAAAPAAAAPAAAAPAAPAAEAPAAPAPAAAPVPAPTPAPAMPEPPKAAGSRGETRVKMNRMRQRIAERLKEAQNTAACLTTFQECDMGALMELRKAHKDEFEKVHGVKLGFMSAFVAASTKALIEIPAVNAYIDDDAKEIVYRDYCDVSVAVASPNGLVVPVLRNTEAMSSSASAPARALAPNAPIVFSTSANDMASVFRSTGTTRPLGDATATDTSQ